MPTLLICVLTVALVSTLCLFLFYTGLRKRTALLAWFLTLLIAAGIAAYRFNQYERIYGSHDDALAKACVFQALFILTGTAFAIRLYRKWLDGAMTEDERSVGTAGLRAWLSPANLAVGAVVAVSAWQGLGWSLVLMLAFTIGLLLLSPMLNRERATASTPAPVPSVAPGSSEREKVLALLEAGKITADESAELLHALNSVGTAPQPVAPPLSRPRKIALAGAMLVLVGFFLPWFSFSPREQLTATMTQFGIGGEALEQLGHQVLPNTTVTVRGGDLAHGLGWLIIVLGVAGALLPILAPQMEASAQRSAKLLTIGAGGIVVLYVVSQDISSASIGLVLVLVGYACQAIALWQEERRLPAASQVPAPGA
jgi:hypothetical protein